jgi:hypothetical protein
MTSGRSGSRAAVLAHCWASINGYWITAETLKLSVSRLRHLNLMTFLRPTENAAMSNIYAPHSTRTLLIVFAVFLAPVIVVFLYVTGGKLHGMSESPTPETSGETGQ